LSNRRIGLIGDGSQARRIKSALKLEGLHPDCIFKPFLRDDDTGITDNFDEILACDIIFLCSPNDTHFSYLNTLIGGRYIFCEKPPVQTRKHLDALKQLDDGKVHYNFNLRYSELSDFLYKSQKLEFGELISANIVMSHGLATKPNYPTSWRSDPKICPKGVFEIVSIHAIDLIGYHFEVEGISSNNLTNRSTIGTEVDTAYTTIALKNGGQVDVFATYFGPYFFQWCFVFENGLLVFDSGGIVLRGPRDVFDQHGYFTLPPIIEHQLVDNDANHSKSIDLSVALFLKTAMGEGVFDLRDRNLSFFSNSLMF